MMKEYMSVINIINQSDSFYVYGAGDVAEQVAFCLLNPPFSKTIKAFVVSRIDASARKEIYGVPVIALDNLQTDGQALFVVAVVEKFRDEIVAGLHARGYLNIVCLTFEADATAEVRRKTFAEWQKAGVFPDMEYLPEMPDEAVDGTAGDFEVYVARCHKDRKLASSVTNRPWEIDIQVGAALTKERIAAIADDVGDTISEKNENYCELTALYWIWKHSTAEYVGLSHYRRRFDLSQDEISYIKKVGVDVLVTIPLFNVPSVGYMYMRNHVREDWERLESVIQELYPEYLCDFQKIADGNFYFAYNMFVMKRVCLNNYCEWLFSILKHCENSEINRDAYQNRYIGFLAERLLGVYLLHHKNELKLAYTDKNFYE